MTEEERKMNDLLGLDLSGNRKITYDAFQKAYQEIEIISTTPVLANHELSEQERKTQSTVGITDLVFDINNRLTRKMQFLKESMKTINNPKLAFEINQLEQELDKLAKEKFEAIKIIQNVHREIDKKVVDVFQILEKNNEMQTVTHEDMEMHESNAQDLYGFEMGLKGVYGDDYLNNMSQDELNEYIHLTSQKSGIPEEEVALNLESKMNLEEHSKAR